MKQLQLRIKKLQNLVKNFELKKNKVFKNIQFIHAEIVKKNEVISKFKAYLKGYKGERYHQQVNMQLMMNYQWFTRKIYDLIDQEYNEIKKLQTRRKTLLETYHHYQQKIEALDNLIATKLNQQQRWLDRAEDTEMHDLINTRALIGKDGSYE